MKVNIEKSWSKQLNEEFKKKYFSDLVKYLINEYANHVIYPPGRLIFNSFNLCPFDKLKVVIIGQDPYHGEGQANGLSFSVRDNIKHPPSLQNIFKELHSDLNLNIPDSGSLINWSKQGVLLLNSILTVRKSQPGSHRMRGWEIFTDRVIELISNKKNNIVFILWGAYAMNKGIIVDKKKHLVLESPHPSPFSANKGFFGSKPFSKTNNYLRLFEKKEINW
tara:strand:- start:232 stop:894 length:663 start_codon:yes stop_codon:yes gene_type:complete